MTGTTWFLVADSAHARLFEEEGARFEEIEGYVHPAGARRPRATFTGPVGRRGPGARQGLGEGSRPGLQDRNLPQDVESARFAKALAARLKDGLRTRRFRVLVLAAPPRFLGLLRASLDPQVARRVVAEEAKDDLRLPQARLAGKLRSLRLTSR
ncbi:MAG TPA: host attachment protein [Holophagaceae bacterium]|nr:host attachment protein [Holophagaceae bacterium]